MRGAKRTSCRMMLEGMVRLGEGGVEKGLGTPPKDRLWKAVTPFVI